MAQATPENSETAPTTAGDVAAAGASASQTTPTVSAHVASTTTVQLPQEAPAEVRAATQATPQDIFDLDPRWRPGLRWTLIVASVIVIISVLAIAGYFLYFLGGGLTFLGGILALVPLVIVLLGVRWIDRWEPEPRLLQLLAVLWGAGASIGVAVTFDYGLSMLYASAGLGENYSILLQVAVQAPIVEEFAKGFGLLLIYLFARRYFDGPVDGIVYAALIGGGFAFTENIQYFALQINEAGGLDRSVAEIFFIRGLLSPFAHVMFTAFTGFFIGLAARKGTALGGIGFFLIGVIPAIFLHMFWNGILFFIYDFYAYYLVVQVPLFAIAVLIVVLLRRREAKMTQLRLGEYAAAGWFNQSEVNTLGTAAGRRQALAWARQRGMKAVMKEYIKDATHLAFTRNRIVSGRDRIGSQQDEALLLAQVTESRTRLAAATPVVRAAAPTATPPAPPTTPAPPAS
jgi:RsiW-degrading membrane proteinase PrsW (M82 family)